MKSPNRLLEERELLPLYDLMNAMAVAIEHAGISEKSVRFGSGSVEGLGWMGWNIDALSYIFYIRVANPDILAFLKYRTVDPSKYDGSSGRLYENDGGWSCEIEFDLSSDGSTFIDLDKQHQI